MKVFGYEVPQAVFDALCARLDKGSATAYQLAAAAQRAGVPSSGEHCYTAHRVVDRWLRLQKKQGTVEYRGRVWHATLASREFPNHD